MAPPLHLRFYFSLSLLTFFWTGSFVFGQYDYDQNGDPITSTTTEPPKFQAEHAGNLQTSSFQGPSSFHKVTNDSEFNPALYNDGFTYRGQDFRNKATPPPAPPKPVHPWVHYVPIPAGVGATLGLLLALFGYKLTEAKLISRLIIFLATADIAMGIVFLCVNKELVKEPEENTMFIWGYVFTIVSGLWRILGAAKTSLGGLFLWFIPLLATLISPFAFAAGVPCFVLVIRWMIIGPEGRPQPVNPFVVNPSVVMGESGAGEASGEGEGSKEKEQPAEVQVILTSAGDKGPEVVTVKK